MKANRPNALRGCRGAVPFVIRAANLNSASSFRRSMKLGAVSSSDGMPGKRRARLAHYSIDCLTEAPSGQSKQVDSAMPVSAKKCPARPGGGIVIRPRQCSAQSAAPALAHQHHTEGSRQFQDGHVSRPIDPRRNNRRFPGLG